jgi:hypothetical protein
LDRQASEKVAAVLPGRDEFLHNPIQVVAALESDQEQQRRLAEQFDELVRLERVISASLARFDARAVGREMSKIEGVDARDKILNGALQAPIEQIIKLEEKIAALANSALKRKLGALLAGHLRDQIERLRSEAYRVAEGGMTPTMKVMLQRFNELVKQAVPTGSSIPVPKKEPTAEDKRRAEEFKRKRERGEEDQRRLSPLVEQVVAALKLVAQKPAEAMPGAKDAVERLKEAFGTVGVMAVKTNGRKVCEDLLEHLQTLTQ